MNLRPSDPNDPKIHENEQKLRKMRSPIFLRSQINTLVDQILQNHRPDKNKIQELATHFKLECSHFYTFLWN